MIATAVDIPHLHSRLTAGAAYYVFGIQAGEYRLLDDRGEPGLYPADHFEIVDPAEPVDWISEAGPDGERYAYPPALNAPGFFEDFSMATPPRRPPSGRPSTACSCEGQRFGSGGTSQNAYAAPSPC